jgi:hypothetical protein
MKDSKVNHHHREQLLLLDNPVVTRTLQSLPRKDIEHLLHARLAEIGGFG